MSVLDKYRTIGGKFNLDLNDFLSSNDRYLVANYLNASFRKYHNMEHAQAVFNTMLENLSMVETNYGIFQVEEIHVHAAAVAAAFHDVIQAHKHINFMGDYDPSKNEYNSNVVFTKSDSFASMTAEARELVSAAILATAHHTSNLPESTSIFTLCFMDADLAQLGSGIDFALANNSKIHEEQGVSSLPRNVVSGTNKFLKLMLEKKKIFYYRLDLEESARKNISAIIEVNSNALAMLG